jgi:hypothetical protein
MRKFFLKITIFFLIINLFSCKKWIADKFLLERPNQEFIIDQNASVEFKQGWDDGCEVGMSSASNTFYKMFYRSNKVDGYKMTGSPEYKTAWNTSFWYCYRYDYIKQKGSLWGSYFSGYR